MDNAAKRNELRGRKRAALSLPVKRGTQKYAHGHSTIQDGRNHGTSPGGRTFPANDVMDGQWTLVISFQRSNVRSKQHRSCDDVTCNCSESLR